MRYLDDDESTVEGSDEIAEYYDFHDDTMSTASSSCCEDGVWRIKCQSEYVDDEFSVSSISDSEDEDEEYLMQQHQATRPPLYDVNHSEDSMLTVSIASIQRDAADKHALLRETSDVTPDTVQLYYDTEDDSSVDTFAY